MYLCKQKTENMKTLTGIKATLLAAYVLMLAVGAKAQDVIVLVDASEIQAKVITVGTNEITYKRWESPNGPDYQILKKDVFFIRYMDGSKDVFNSKLLESGQGENTSTSLKGKYIHNILLNGYLELGVPFTATAVGPELSGTLGVRFYDYAFVGFNAGIDALFTSYILTGVKGCIISVPLMFNFRAYYPVNDGLYPFFDFSVGLNNIFSSAYYYTQDGESILSHNKRMSYDGLTARVKILFGIEYKRIEAGLGYDCVPLGDGNAMHLGYFKFGIRLGKLN